MSLPQVRHLTPVICEGAPGVAEGEASGGGIGADRSKSASPKGLCEGWPGALGGGEPKSNGLPLPEKSNGLAGGGGGDGGGLLPGNAGTGSAGIEGDVAGAEKSKGAGAAGLLPGDMKSNGDGAAAAGGAPDGVV
jgi:hypothetical protein